MPSITPDVNLSCAKTVESSFSSISAERATTKALAEDRPSTAQNHEGSGRAQDPGDLVFTPGDLGFTDFTKIQETWFLQILDGLTPLYSQSLFCIFCVGV